MTTVVFNQVPRAKRVAKSASAHTSRTANALWQRCKLHAIYPLQTRFCRYMASQHGLQTMLCGCCFWCIGNNYVAIVLSYAQLVISDG